MGDVLDSGKPFEELTPEELAELEAREWTSEEITKAIELALKVPDWDAVVALLRRLAPIDPYTAAGIIDGITLAQRAAFGAAYTVHQPREQGQ